MNPLAFGKYARQRAYDLEREAARQRLARNYRRPSPNLRLEHLYGLVKALF